MLFIVYRHHEHHVAAISSHVGRVCRATRRERINVTPDTQVTRPLDFSTGARAGQAEATATEVQSRPRRQILSRVISDSQSVFRFNTAMKASCGTLTLPIIFMRFLPLACLLSSFFLREMSPP